MRLSNTIMKLRSILIGTCVRQQIPAESAWRNTRIPKPTHQVQVGSGRHALCGQWTDPVESCLPRGVEVQLLVGTTLARVFRHDPELHKAYRMVLLCCERNKLLCQLLHTFVGCIICNELKDRTKPCLKRTNCPKFAETFWKQTVPFKTKCVCRRDLTLELYIFSTRFSKFILFNNKTTSTLQWMMFFFWLCRHWYNTKGVHIRRAQRVNFERSFSLHAIRLYRLHEDQPSKPNALLKTGSLLPHSSTHWPTHLPSTHRLPPSTVCLDSCEIRNTSPRHERKCAVMSYRRGPSPPNTE